MGELRYRPNNAARHLVSRRSRIIGFIGSLTFHCPARIMVSVEQTAKKHGYNVMIAELPEVNADEVRRAIDELCARQVDGIVILIPPELEMDFIRDVCRDVPLSPSMSIWAQACRRSWSTRTGVRSWRSDTSPG
jgi:DNA-binding LacI/PurR family transcriptional regulator